MKLFVYGTLKKGYGNHPVLDGAKFIGNCRMWNAEMYTLGGYPGLKKTDKLEDCVDGELYEIDDAILKRCDLLEGHPKFYLRKQGQVQMTPTRDPKFPTDIEECSYYEYPHPVDQKHRITGTSW
jgi:gamma-glutamylcyclotransferase (GGCT)/AIG2-like uncharacterized protein YtfP